MPKKNKHAEPAPGSPSAAAHHQFSSGISQPAVPVLQPVTAENRAGSDEQHVRNVPPFQLKPGKTGLPGNVNSGAGKLAAYSRGAHNSATQPAQLRAPAYTQGISAGGALPHPHAPWPVVQQRRVNATVQLKPGKSGPELATAAAPGYLVQLKKPKSVKEMLYDRINSNKGAKKEIQDLLTAARKPLPTEEEKDLAVYTDAVNGGYSVLDKVVGAYAHYVPRAKEMIRSWLDKAATYGKKKNGVKYFLQKFREAIAGDSHEGTLLNSYFKHARDKGEASALTNAFLGLKKRDQDGAFDDSTLDPAFLAAGSTNTVKGEISGPSVIYKDGDNFDIENKRANTMLERTKGMSPIQRYYTIARYIIDNHADGADYKHRTALILEDYLRTHLLAYIHQVPPPTPGRLDGIRLTNDVKYANDNTAVPTTTTIYANIQQAWNQVSRAVSPAILETAGQCAVRVRRRQGIRDYLFMRAFASNRQISIGENGTVGQLLHEYGHHIEDYGKTSRWLKLQQLLHERSKGQDLQSIFPVSIPGVISTDELQYAATMPAATYAGGYFGYSAKYYDWGSTELVSTVLEVWNRPERIVSIALADPDLFMAVLGVLRE